MLSELSAVNSMLAAIGTAPVNTITGPVSPDVAMARQLLDDARRKMLLRGWNFNTQRGVTMSPDGTGRIAVDSDILRLDTSPESYTSVDPVQRGPWLFDRSTNGYTFNAPLIVDLLLDLPWDELPEVAKDYVATAAASQFVMATASDQIRVQAAVRAEAEAYARLRAYEEDLEDCTIFDDHQSRFIIRRYR